LKATSDVYQFHVWLGLYQRPRNEPQNLNGH
jgi:hypothetical protein